MACVSNALIIGGGIAGFASAIALSRLGVRCDVVEAAEKPAGASLGIHGRAAQALDELGVYDECYATGSPWPAEATPAQILDAKGNVVGAPPKRPEWPGMKTSIGVYRPVLLQIMEDAARGLGATLQRGVTVQSIEDVEEQAKVMLSTGEERRYDLVIGADGIGSKTRATIFPDAPKPAYAGQMSIRWMAPGPPIQPEGWYIGPVGRMGFYQLPQNLVYVPAVINSPEPLRLSQDEVIELFSKLLDSYSAPAILELKRRLAPGADIVMRPFEWILLDKTWHRGRTILIGDAAHATTAHMAMGGGMALEDAVVLAGCIDSASNLSAAFDAFMERRLPRVRTVVETSVALSRLEQENAPPSENRALFMSAYEALSEPY